MIDIQKNIRAILAERGIMQKQLAAKLGMTDQALSNWFTRKDDLSFTQIQRICEAAGVEIVDVVTYPDKYVKESEATEPYCENCREKDKIIKNLNLLIEKLQKGK